MTEHQANVTPTAVWFLISQEGQPLGQVYRGKEEALPLAGVRLTNGPAWKRIEVVESRELASTCGLRRFRVVVRVLE